MPAIKELLARHGIATSAVELQLTSFPDLDKAALLAMACNECDCEEEGCETPQMHWVGGGKAKRSPFAAR